MGRLRPGWRACRHANFPGPSRRLRVPRAQIFKQARRGDLGQKLIRTQSGAAGKIAGRRSETRRTNADDVARATRWTGRRRNRPRAWSSLSCPVWRAPTGRVTRRRLVFAATAPPRPAFRPQSRSAGATRCFPPSRHGKVAERDRRAVRTGSVAPTQGAARAPWRRWRKRTSDHHPDPST